MITIYFHRNGLFFFSLFLYSDVIDTIAKENLPNLARCDATIWLKYC